MEKDNDKEKDNISKINQIIGTLVYRKSAMIKCYNYYHGYRDAEQFKHIEENYGIGVPTSVNFTPLMKNHIDVLIGEYLGLDPELTVSCKDEATISNIMRDKQLKIYEAQSNFIKKNIKNVLISILINNKEVNIDPALQDQLDKIKEDLNNSYISEYEIAVHNLLKYFRQSRDIDFKLKLKELLLNIFISGTCYYQVKPTDNEKNVSFKILNPIDTFIERNPNSVYLNESNKVVIRKWMTIENILNEYRKYMTEEALSSLENSNHSQDNSSNTLLVRGQVSTSKVNSESISGYADATDQGGLLSGLESHPFFPFNNTTDQRIHRTSHLIPVYEIEWIEADKKTGKLDRYEAIKIGGDIYIYQGKSKFIVRNNDETKCKLTVNGIFFSDNNGMPFSLMANSMNLQDKYDLLIYYRDNLIATSGTVGDWVDLAYIPVSLGVEMPERLQKWLAYKKGCGLGIIDSSQEGAQQMPNTIFSGFDDTVKLQAIQAISLAIQSVEQQASKITGVFDPKLGQVEQRDAVSNVKIGINQSSLVTKQYFHIMDLIYKEINFDLLNLAKLVYKKGITGTIILGDKYSQIFTSLPEHYTTTDFDLHIEDSTTNYKDRETIKILSGDLIKSGLADPEMIINIISSSNMTELKNYINKAMKIKKEENNIISQLQQQLQKTQEQSKQLEQQLQQLNNERKQLEMKLQTNNETDYKISLKKLSLEEKKINNEKDYQDKIIDTKKSQLQLEEEQMSDSNPYNNGIKNRI